MALYLILPRAELGARISLWLLSFGCCFSTGTLQGTNVPRPTRVSSNCATHHGLLRRAVGDFVTPCVLEKLFDHSCSLLNLQVHTWGMSLASSGKFV